MDERGFGDLLMTARWLIMRWRIWDAMGVDGVGWD